MKKILFCLLLALLVAIPANAYIIQKGDTLWDLFGSNWKQVADANGITDPTKLQIGQEIVTEEEKFGSIARPEMFYETSLTRSLALGGTETEIYVSTLPTETAGYIVINPDSSTNRELAYYSGTTSTSGNHLTGVVRGLAFSGTTGSAISDTYSSIRAKRHSSGERVTMSNGRYEQLIIDQLNGLTTSSLKGTDYNGFTFYSFPIVSSTGYTGLPTQNGQIATKYYVDNVGAGGFTAANVSTTLGLYATGSSPETVGVNASSTGGLTFDTNGALKVKHALNSGIGTDANGTYVERSDDFDWIGTHTFATSSLFYGAGQVSSTPNAYGVPQADVNNKIDSWWLNPYIQKSFIAGESIIAGNALIVGGENAYAFATQGTKNSSSPTATASWTGQTFLTRSTANYLTKITLYLTDAGVGSQTFTLDVFATSAGKPTGTSLGSATVASTGSLSSTAKDFVFSSPINISGSTTYSFVVKGSNNSFTMDIQSSGNPYSGGTLVTTSDSGSNWTIEADKDAKFIIYTIDTISGRVYKSNSTLDCEFANNFIGFANETKNAGESIIVNITGVEKNQTGLTIGDTYYLSDTSGSVSSTAGTVSRKIGLSLSATEILIKHDNP